MRTLGGLTTEEIARAFLVMPEAMKRRLSRAKDKISRQDPVQRAGRTVLPERLAAVLASST